MVEDSSLCSQSIQIGRLNPFVAVEAEVIPTEGVVDNDNDIHQGKSPFLTIDDRQIAQDGRRHFHHLVHDHLIQTLVEAFPRVFHC